MQINRGLSVLLVGGYGTFGSRLVSLLEGDPRVTLIVAGRNAAKADAFCNSRGPTAAKLRAIAFDRNGDVAAQIASIRPDIVVDASGPFQAYGDRPYRVHRSLHGVGRELSRSRRRFRFRDGGVCIRRTRDRGGALCTFGRLDLSCAHRGGRAATFARHDARGFHLRRHCAVAAHRCG